MFRTGLSRLWAVVTIYTSMFDPKQQALSKELTLGLLIPTGGNIAWNNSISAMSIAFSDMKTNNVLPENYSLSFIWRNTMADPVQAVGMALELKNEGVDVIVGPPISDSTVPVGLMTSYWNMPHISWVSTDPELSKKQTYATLIRTIAPFSKIGEFIRALFHYFDWRRAGMITVDKNSCSYAPDGVRGVFQESNLTLKEDIHMDESPSRDIMYRYLKQLRKNTRIIIMCVTYAVLPDVLLMAHDLEMTSGDFVFFTLNSSPYDKPQAPWENHDRQEHLRQAYRSVYDVTLGTYSDSNIESFREEVIERMADPPWNYTYPFPSGLRGSSYSPYLYDAVYLYGLLINQTVGQGGNQTDGKRLFSLTDGLSFRSRVTGQVEFDSNGDREPIYWLWDYNNDSAVPQVIAIGNIKRPIDSVLQFKRQPIWLTADSKAPPDVPACGWTDELCPVDNSGINRTIIITIVTILGGLTLIMVVIQLLRKRQFEKELSMMLWRVNYKQIEFGTHKKGLGSVFSMSSRISGHLSKTGSSTVMQAGNQVFIEVGNYKGRLVAIKTVHKDSVTPDRADLIELKQMCELKQENLNPFVGACIDPPHICLLYQYCSKGSLQDILENDDIKLDWVFKYSLISDIVNGMSYIHTSPVKSHGRLKSTNCVVDSRWLLKITDYGLNNMTQGQQLPQPPGEYEQYRRMLWTAPEFLRQTHPPPNGTQPGDVYSFGIILHEVFYRLGVFGSVKHTPKDIVENIRTSTTPPFRPRLQAVDSPVDQYLVSLMEDCWNELPQRRPDFQSVKRVLKSHNKGNKGNIMDNMLKMMESYANNLEDLVEQRTNELVQEKKKTDKLLYRLLPPLVAEKLKKGETVDPELFHSVTIYFSDIVGFTKISAQSSPMQVVDLLNQLYTLFDDIIELHDVYKVETIGDAYMVVSGVPVPNGDLHTAAIADMALDILSALMDFTVPHMPQQKLRIRIGAHTGACCAGVVGLTMPRYCLFGDTVNTASRMESNGEGQRIHISQATCDGLQQMGAYRISPRGEITIKGKGVMQTYWLEGKEGFNHKLPDSSC